jgi:hypothetical protein
MVRKSPAALAGAQKRSPWRPLRIALLLLVLAIVASQTWLDRITTTTWRAPLWIGIFPLNADGSAAADRYVRALTPAAFAGIERFFAREAQRYEVAVTQPVRIELYPVADEMPPLLASGAGPLATAWWSLKLRWFAFHAADVEGRAPSHIRVFVLYHDPAATTTLPHSLGLEKGLIGVVHGFADRDMRGENEIVIAHEVLHTLGATDKYDLATNAPLHPWGFAEPDLKPLFPQRRTEIMAGRRPISEREYEIPEDLRSVVVGPLTAAEIRWVRP